MPSHDSDQFCPQCGQSIAIHADGPLLRCGACGREWPTIGEVLRLRAEVERLRAALRLARVTPAEPL